MSLNTNELTSKQARTADLTESERYALLSSERCRVVLDILEERTTDVQLEDLASEVTEREADLDPEESETVESVKITLHHKHLPKMGELGVLTYSPNSHRIS